MDKYINYSPTLIRRASESLQLFMPLSRGENNSFAAFMGNPTQRSAVAVQGMLRAVENRGIIYLHGGQAHCYRVLDDLQRQRTAHHRKHLVIREPNRPGETRNNSGFYYDPLYGLDTAAAINSILSAIDKGPSSLGESGLRARLADLLLLCEHIAMIAPDIFGEYPFNLDFLLELSAMGFERLKELFWAELPIELANRLDRDLSNGSLHAAGDAIRAYAECLKNRLWTPRPFQQHTRVSIASAMANREVISIYLGGMQNNLTNCIDIELDVLVHRNIPFLLIADGVNIADSRLGNRFLSEHSGAIYSTALLGETAKSIIGDEHEDIGCMMAVYDQVILFAAANAAVAEPFSACFDSYYRLVKEKSSGKHREFFDFLPNYSSGTAMREHEERSIRTNDLTGLRRGALLCGKSQPTPTLVRRFDL